jgi:hypothetical protein
MSNQVSVFARVGGTSAGLLTLVSLALGACHANASKAPTADCASPVSGQRMTRCTAKVALQNATATFSQESFGGNPIGAAIDGVITSNNGWAIYPDADASSAHTSTQRTQPQTAVFETVSDLSARGLTIKLSHLHPQAGHSLGRFRLSVTGDARTEFADGKPKDGAVAANWVVLHPVRVSASGGIQLTVGEDDSILARGAAIETVYEIAAKCPLANVTGFRIEALADQSLPDDGPGLYPNGNFVLTELVVESSPSEPSPDGVPTTP